MKRVKETSHWSPCAVWALLRDTVAAPKLLGVLNLSFKAFGFLVVTFIMYNTNILILRASAWFNVPELGLFSIFLYQFPKREKKV